MRATRYHGARDVRIEDVERGEDPHPITGEAVPVRFGHESGGTVTGGRRFVVSPRPVVVDQCLPVPIVPVAAGKCQ
jgi:hypothetical protein